MVNPTPSTPSTIWSKRKTTTATTTIATTNDNKSEKEMLRGNYYWKTKKINSLNRNNQNDGRNELTSNQNDGRNEQNNE